jgi:hypothetical protein
LERAEGVINVIVRELAALEGFLDQTSEEADQPAASATVHHLPEPERSSAAGERATGSAAEERAEDAQAGSSMRAVAPAVQSFAVGRRR